MVSGSGNSRLKSNKGNKIEFAKDSKQATLAVVVFVLFLFSVAYSGIKAYKESHPQPVVNNNIATNNTDPNPADSLGMPAQQSPDINNNIPPETPEKLQQSANDIYSQTVNLQNSQPKKMNQNYHSTSEDVDILVKGKTTGKSGKMTYISVDNAGRTDPFLPIEESIAVQRNAQLPSLTAPPETVPYNSEASKVMKTTISGILYDKYSPSAIINIEGADYLVKSGDIINGYRILSISKNNVIVQLGRNVYRAGVGELLSPAELKCNTIANLNKKFGGNNIPISVRKKVY